jgi:enterochelin esterase family protein
MESVPPEDRQKRMATFLPMADVSLPNAPPQPYFEKGDRSKSMIESKRVGEWTVHVYRPKGFTGKLPLVVLFDGWSYVTELSAPVTVEKLIAAGKIRPVMLAMIDHAPGKRNSDLTCNEEFTTKLATEVVPWLRSNYAIAEEPAAVGGMSYGGLAASFAALRYPKVFGAVLSQSGSYWWKQEWMATQPPPAGVRYYLEVGLMEVGTPGGRASMLESNRRLRDLLKSKNVAVRYSEFNGDHSALNWRGSFADGLMALFGPGL